MPTPRDFLLVFDRAYWVLGQHAAFLAARLQARGMRVRSAPWREVVRRPPPPKTEVVPLCVGIARHLLEAGIPVRRSAVVSEAYWGEDGGSDPVFIEKVLTRLECLAVINQPYQRRLQELLGESVALRRIHQFVDTELFRPGVPPLTPTWGERFRERGREGLVVGWCGDARKAAKRVEWVQALIEAPELSRLRFRLATKRHQIGRFVAIGQMPGWYAGLDLLICTSENEGNPMPPLEALACGVPVVTTRVGVMPEVVVDGVNGYLVDTALELREKLEHLDREPELLKTLSDQTRPSLLASPFAPERAMDEWVAALFDGIPGEGATG